MGHTNLVHIGEAHDDIDIHLAHVFGVCIYFISYISCRLFYLQQNLFRQCQFPHRNSSM